MAEGIGALAEIAAKMSSIKEMVERDAAQASQQEAAQQAERAAEDQSKLNEFSAFVETAHLIAAADGHVSDAERASLAHGVATLTQSRYSEDDIHNMIKTAGDRLQSEGKEARIAAIASTITDAELRRAAFTVGAGLAWLDRGVGEKEGLMLQAIARAFDIPMNEMHQLMAKAK